MKKALFIISLFLITYFYTMPVSAEVVLDDGFNDTSQVDLTKTTAKVDTVNHWVVLPWQSLSSSIKMLKNTLGYATASQEGIRLYELNDATGRVELNPIYSCPWVADATGVSVRQDNLNIWAITEESIAYYKYNGAGMSNDPALKTTGLLDVLSVAAFNNSDSALLLQSEENMARITRYDAGSNLTASLVFTTNIRDPVAISMVNDSPDFMLYTTDSAYYFSYDDAGGTYAEDPARRINGLTNVLSGSSDGTGNSILSSTDFGYYMNLDTGGASRVDVLSPGPVPNPVAVSLNPGTYEQVYIDENGNVRWWSYNDITGRMVRDTSLEVSGLTLNRGYARPGSYYSKPVNTAMTYDAARLTVTQDVPAGTSVTYSVSSDGGTTFTNVLPGTWAAVPRGNRFVVRAVLDTANPQLSPKILHLTLEVAEDMVLEGQVVPYPAERGRNATIRARAVSLSSGAPVSLDSCAVKYPLETKANGNPALPAGHSPTDDPMAFYPGSGWWEYTFTVPEKTVGGVWPDDGVYLVGITGFKGASLKQTTLNLEVSGHVLRRLIIRTLNW